MRGLQALAAAADVDERAIDQGADERLEEIFRDARGFEVAVEDDVVAVADDDDFGCGIADFGQMIDVRHRVGDAADVNHQQMRPTGSRQLLHCLVDVAVHDLLIGDAEIGEGAAHDALGIGIKQIGPGRP